uniref:Wall-associated receptor kinase 3 n=1 Tax=Aegilops tauschii TaxID=37682 RepID=M8BYF6_AEGTA
MSARLAPLATAMLCAVVAALLLLAAPPGEAATSRSNCTTHCGNISIPYPFGVEPGCYHDSGFNLTRNQSYSPPQLFLGDGTVQVLDIDLPNGTVRINSKPLEILYGDNGKVSRRTWRAGGLGYAADGPYFVAGAGRNNLVALGCNFQVVLLGENNNLVSSCSPFCPGTGYKDTDTCSGITCCQATILEGRASYGLLVQRVGFGYYRSWLNVLIMESDYLLNVTDYSYDQYTVPSMAGRSTAPYVIPMGCHLPAAVITASVLTTPQILIKVLFMVMRINGITAVIQIIKIGVATRSTSSLHQELSDLNLESLHHAISTNVIIQTSIHVTAIAETHTEDMIASALLASWAMFLHQMDVKTLTNVNTRKHIHVMESESICLGHSIAGVKMLPEINDFVFSSMIPYFTGLGVGLVASGSSIILLLVLAAPFIARKMKLNRANNLKRRLFKQNHGLLLQQLISQKTDFGERMIIPLLDLEKATNNFDRTREAGGGGHGVVYKGILDLQVVAIKKSKIVVQREIDDFINEVAILSQINHRNVVKLIGCCLETEVPLLVYEFISNGTLDQHLHVEGPISLSWDDRIRIALDVSRALSYLHSAASMPIYHRDIKSSNILLDDNLTAKVSDFGASRYIPIDKTGVTTAVQGTIELLTRKKPCLYLSGGNDGVGLVSHFVSLVAEGNLDEIIDPQLIEEENGEVQEVATLAAMCIKLKGEEQPTMREAEMKLEILRVNMRVAPDTAAPRRYDGGQDGSLWMPAEGVVVEASRQYTIEEEILSSASYPR